MWRVTGSDSFRCTDARGTVAYPQPFVMLFEGALPPGPFFVFDTPWRGRLREEVLKVLSRQTHC
jgi:hypothetical protein